MFRTTDKRTASWQAQYQHYAPAERTQVSDLTDEQLSMLADEADREIELYTGWGPSKEAYLTDCKRRLAAYVSEQVRRTKAQGVGEAA